MGVAGGVSVWAAPYRPNIHPYVVAVSFVEWFQPRREQLWSFIGTWPKRLREEAGRQAAWRLVSAEGA